MLTILLVEDDPLNQTVVKDLFAFDNLPGELVCVDSAEEALQMLPSLNPMVVLMDLMLPGMTGIEAARLIRMREQEEHRSPVYIVAITASGIMDDRDKCLAAGMDDYISKPVRRGKLAEILQKCEPVDCNVNAAATVTKEAAIEKPI